MATEAQIAANRANAQRSTGPRTEAGKQAVAQNRLEHGLSGGAFRLLPWESAEEFEALPAGRAPARDCDRTASGRPSGRARMAAPPRRLSAIAVHQRRRHHRGRPPVRPLSALPDHPPARLSQMSPGPAQAPSREAQGANWL